jgi:hypothetical protein
VIIRISSEGQYNVPDEDIDTLNQLDSEAVAACTDDDEQKFEDAFGRLLEFVRTNGRPVSEDVLEGSDVILPPPDTSLEEAKEEFTGEGLIPG